MGNIIAIKESDGTVSLVGKQGTTWELFLTLKHPDGSPLNLTGYILRGQFRASYSAVEKTDIACSIVSASEGKVSISVAAILTADIAAYKDSVDITKLKSYKGTGVYVYDIEMVDIAGKVSRILEGKLYVDPEVTK